MSFRSREVITIIKVACIQSKAGNIREYKDSWARVLQLVDRAVSEEVDLVVLPESAYPAYFLGYDPKEADRAMAGSSQVIRDLSAVAREKQIYLAAGINFVEQGVFYNGGLLFNPEGEEILRTAKSNLWHFDHKWVSPGASFPVIDTALGRVGLMICADARAPEIPRILALKGAEMIIDLVNLTSTGKDPEKLSNPQIDYMLPVRALENRVWLIVADKVGLEAGTVLHCGRSCVINPDGEVIKMASSVEEEILYAEIDPKVERGKIPTREPKFYLTKNTEELPIYKKMQEPLVLPETETQTAAVWFDYTDLWDYLAKAEEFLAVLESQDTKLILLPTLSEKIDPISVRETLREKLTSKDTVVVMTGYHQRQGERYQSSLVFSSHHNYGSYSKLHVAEDERLAPGDPTTSLIPTPLGVLGLMHDQEGLIPEVARGLMLNGVELLIWVDREKREKGELVARSRAAENKVFLIRGGSREKEDYSMILGPNGNILASTMVGVEQAATALIVTALSRSKTVVPGTNAVTTRIPEIYKELI